MSFLFTVTYITLLINFVKMCYNNNTLVVSWISFLINVTYIIIIEFLLHMMYSRMHMCNYTNIYLYTYSFFLLCIEFPVAHKQSSFCQSCPRHIKDWSGMC
jgi:chromate transport protein ChrA